MIEDQLEDVPGGGMEIPKSLHSGPFPATLPADANYKLMKKSVQLRFKGDKNQDFSSPVVVARLIYDIPEGVALYRMEVDGHTRVSLPIGLATIGHDGAHDTDVAILT